MRRHLRHALFTLVAVGTIASGQASAQSTGKPAAAPGSSVPTSALAYRGTDGIAIYIGPQSPLPIGGFREAFQLAAANTASPAVTLYGGDYIFEQTCSAYGAVKLQRLGPDGTSWIDSLTKSSADTVVGTGVTAGSNAQVRVTLSGTTGCNVTISRVPN